MEELRTSDFDYYLPKKYIAQQPIEPRDASRLMVLDRGGGEIIHTKFSQLPFYLNKGDLLVVNETKVMHARLLGKKHESGGKVELLLLQHLDGNDWEVIVKGKNLSVGKKIVFDDGNFAEIVAELDGPKRIARFYHATESTVKHIGQVPLPPYIHKTLADPDRYQTIYANQPGSAAAPTAGLHFTDRLIRRLETIGIEFASIILHIGLDTFAPVNVDHPANHTIHTEWCNVSTDVANKVNETHSCGGRVIAVGTTSVRALETAANVSTENTLVSEYKGFTDLFILPGYKFRVVDAMVTNFHLPRSTLVMMVSAFAGRDRLLGAYEEAIAMNYRFYSFGDAMLII